MYVIFILLCNNQNRNIILHKAFQLLLFYCIAADSILSQFSFILYMVSRVSNSKCHVVILFLPLVNTSK